MFKEFRLNPSDLVKQAYMDLFGLPYETNNKPWIPSLVCKSCVESLRLWVNKKRPHFKYQTPMIWREPSDHHSECYFCVVNITGINRKNHSKWTYPNLLTAVRPVLYARNTSDPEPIVFGL